MIAPMPRQDPPPAHELARLRAELLAAQQTREQLERQLAAARAGLADFAHTVSHDLRANLRHVRAYTELVCEDFGTSLDARPLAHLGTVANSARLMGLQIDGLTDLAQIESATVHTQALDVRALLERLGGEVWADGTPDAGCRVSFSLPLAPQT